MRRDTLKPRPPKRKGVVIQYEKLYTRERDRCRDKAVKLARILSRREGRTVTPPEAIRYALTETLWRRRNG